jgi:hypothetical protein
MIPKLEPNIPYAKPTIFEDWICYVRLAAGR